ncbi:hypothetical protein MPSEU_001013500 [Mayamaea pseudoterrestris]|nr:hypothetical protein MPSEU_001013500 [Mayamaea pseudoterrestris]
MSRRQAPWENNERHYCAACNAWMGSDRQSILLHNNGKKHQENVSKQLDQQRLEKRQQEQQQSFMQKSLEKMEQAARQNMAQESGRYAVPSGPMSMQPAVMDRYGVPIASSYAQPMHTVSSSYALPPPPPPSAPKIETMSSKQERKEWESRKKERSESKRKADDGDEEDDHAFSSKKRFKLKLAPGQGVYTRDSKTFLEGVAFGNILEADMPIQVWTGALLANNAEKQLPERDMYWKNALVIAVRENLSATELEDRLVVDLSYLQTNDDTQETLLKSVSLNRIRIELGADPSIPDNVEEARLLAMGGEEIVVKNEDEVEIDEATGLSSWTTVKVKRTTVRQEVKEERGRLREKRKAEAMEDLRKAKEAEARKMEEAKVSNADDSALGAFDVWSRTKDGYKGVSIHDEPKMDVHEFSKKLSEGKETVAFKKTGFKSKTKKQNVRRTSADD